MSEGKYLNRHRQMRFWSVARSKAEAADPKVGQSGIRSGHGSEAETERWA